MTPKFIIIDWAGNVLFNGREFDSFEDGWEFLYEHFQDVSDDELEAGFFDDYFVVQEQFTLTELIREYQDKAQHITDWDKTSPIWWTTLGSRVRIEAEVRGEDIKALWLSISEIGKPTKSTRYQTIQGLLRAYNRATEWKWDTEGGFDSMQTWTAEERRQTFRLIMGGAA